MPDISKNISEDQNKQNAHVKHLRELEFAKNEHSEETDINYLVPEDHNIKAKIEKKSQDKKAKKNHLETIINNINRLNAQKTSFQQRIQEAQAKESAELAK